MRDMTLTALWLFLANRYRKAMRNVIMCSYKQKCNVVIGHATMGACGVSVGVLLFGLVDSIESFACLYGITVGRQQVVDVLYVIQRIIKIK